MTCIYIYNHTLATLLFLAGAGLLPGVGRVPDLASIWPALGWRLDSAGNTCDNEVFNAYLFKHNYANLSIFRFLRFLEYFFATTYLMFIIHNSYLNSGFGVGKIFLNILLMPVNYTLCSQHFYFQSILCFIMAMPPNILILYVITSKLTMSIKYIYI